MAIKWDLVQYRQLHLIRQHQNKKLPFVTKIETVSRQLWRYLSPLGQHIKRMGITWELVSRLSQLLRHHRLHHLMKKQQSVTEMAEPIQQ
jgi:hypothetical protein